MYVKKLEFIAKDEYYFADVSLTAEDTRHLVEVKFPYIILPEEAELTCCFCLLLRSGDDDYIRLCNADGTTKMDYQQEGWYCSEDNVVEALEELEKINSWR